MTSSGQFQNKRRTVRGREWTQKEPAETWNILHEMNTMPSVRILADDGSVIFADVQHLNQMELEVRFSEPMTGTAILED